MPDFETRTFPVVCMFDKVTLQSVWYVFKKMELGQGCPPISSILHCPCYCNIVRLSHPSIGHLRYGISPAPSNEKETIQAAPCLGRTILNFYSKKEFFIRCVLGYQVSFFVRCKYTVHDIQYFQSTTVHLGN